MKIKIFEFGPLAVNTYVLSDETGECVIIDPACWYPHEKETLFNYIVNNNLTVKHLLNTHLHFDHLFGKRFYRFQIRRQTRSACSRRAFAEKNFYSSPNVWNRLVASFCSSSWEIFERKRCCFFRKSTIARHSYSRTFGRKHRFLR